MAEVLLGLGAVALVFCLLLSNFPVLYCSFFKHVPMKWGPHLHAEGSWIVIRDALGVRLVRVDCCERCKGVFWRNF